MSNQGNTTHDLTIQITREQAETLNNLIEYEIDQLKDLAYYAPTTTKRDKYKDQIEQLVTVLDNITDAM